MITFHFPPIAASAAVIGQPPIGFGRRARRPLPAGAFWIALVAGIRFPLRRRAMIVEVRSYRIKPGRREEFLRFFQTRSIPALRAHGMKVLGPLIDLEAIAMPMLESYDIILCETSPGCVFDVQP